MAFNHLQIEKKWQDFWDENKTFKTKDRGLDHPKYYALDMFPYPSGGAPGRVYCNRYCLTC